MKCSLILGLLFFFLGTPAHSQTQSLKLVLSGRDCSLRGMSIPADSLIWLSGSNGHVGRSTDAGRSWQWLQVPGYEKIDFRDIHAFDANTAVIMGIGNPAYILKTRDAGKTWTLVFSKDTVGMFLDAMDFSKDGKGICIGDPLAGADARRTFFVIRTADAGDTWTREPSHLVPAAQQGEAVFSASGTNIALLQSRRYPYAFISGGMASNLYLVGSGRRATTGVPLRIIKGQEATGAFSMATDGKRSFYCIGGNYTAPDAKQDNFLWTSNRGKSWQYGTASQANGYRSCIRMIDKDRLIACGTNGIDLWTSSKTWQSLSTEGFNVCMPAPDKKTVYFAGAKGKIGILKL